MIYRVTHQTTYDYSESVSLCQNLAHLAPRKTARQVCRGTTLRIQPEPAILYPRTDYFGNSATFFSVQEPHKQLTVTAHHVAQVEPAGPLPEPAATPPWEAVRDRLASDRSPETLEAYQFVFDSPYVQAGEELAAYAAPSFLPGRPLLEGVLALTRHIHADFKYDPRATTVATPLREVLSHRRGVCQDFAHLGIACLRSLGLAARYVSGYLATTPAAGKEPLVGADASHAWLSIWCPGPGWIDVDPTNNVVPDLQHILLAWGRDYDDVSPTKGVILGGGKHTVAVAVQVTRSSDDE